MIDWTRVAELRSEVGEEAFAEVVELFLEEVDEVMARLDAAPDAPTLAADLHFVRGSALNLGLKDFCTICQGLERSLAAGETVDLGPLIAAYDASKPQLVNGPAGKSHVA